MLSAGPYRDWSDEDLARLAAQRPAAPDGRTAANTLLGRYAPVVYRWCYRMVEDQELARDLAQDILLSAYGNIGRFEGWGRFAGWLFVISRNRCLDVLRKPALLRDDGAEPGILADPRPGPDREVEDQEEEHALLLLVRQHLTTQEQDALWLRCYERMPVDAITQALGIRQAAGARAVLQTARRKLRAAMERGAKSPRPAPRTPTTGPVRADGLPAAERREETDE